MARHLSPGRGNSGFLLLEVMAAAVLLAVLVVPLTTSVLAALGAADAVRERDAGLATAAAGSEGSEAWGWGPRVAHAAWNPGPALDITVEMRNDSSPTVGVWVDGWLFGEFVPDSDGLLVVGPSGWADAVGCELVIRARQGEEAWGPPWRAIVSSRVGEAPELAASGPVATGGGAGSVVFDRSVVHVSALANPEVRTTTAVGLLEVGPLGLPFFTGLSGAGRCDLAVGPETPEGRVQSWYAEERRAVDLYF
ncbi:MAG: hypothetical protein JXA87_13420 [Thermoleophilia bacterium]|nr:hypothetical protein [Thermoleophilia bacterium]